MVRFKIDNTSHYFSFDGFFVLKTLIHETKKKAGFSYASFHFLVIHTIKLDCVFSVCY